MTRGQSIDGKPPPRLPDPAAGATHKSITAVFQRITDKHLLCRQLIPVTDTPLQKLENVASLQEVHWNSLSLSLSLSLSVFICLSILFFFSLSSLSHLLLLSIFLRSLGCLAAIGILQVLLRESEFLRLSQDPASGS